MATLAFSFGAHAQQQYNPVTQIQWVLATGTTDPTIPCSATANKGGPNYGQPYVNTTSNKLWSCGSAGWFLVSEPSPIVFRGPWNSGTTYNLNDAVSYNGNTYVSLQGGNVNQNPATQTSYWMLLVSGDAGVPSVNGSPSPLVLNGGAVTCTITGGVQTCVVAGGNPTFDQIGSGTNLSHGLVCGNGCVIAPAGTGFVSANEFKGVPFCNGYTPTIGQQIAYTTASTPNPCYTAATPIGFANPMTATGDLIVGGTSGAPLRQGIGSNGQLQTVVSHQPAWNTPFYFEPQNYGALCDGTTDDTVALQAMVDAAPQGSFIVMPYTDNFCVVSSADLVIYHKVLTWYGNGAGIELLNGHTIDIEQGTIVTFNNMGFFMSTPGNSTVFSDVNFVCSVGNLTDLTLNNVTITNLMSGTPGPYTAIQSQGCNYVTLTNSFIDGTINAQTGFLTSDNLDFEESANGTQILLDSMAGVSIRGLFNSVQGGSITSGSVVNITNTQATAPIPFNLTGLAFTGIDGTSNLITESSASDGIISGNASIKGTTSGGVSVPSGGFGSFVLTPNSGPPINYTNLDDGCMQVASNVIQSTGSNCSGGLPSQSATLSGSGVSTLCASVTCTSLGGVVSQSYSGSVTNPSITVGYLTSQTCMYFGLTVHSSSGTAFPVGGGTATGTNFVMVIQGTFTTGDTEEVAYQCVAQ